MSELTDIGQIIAGLQKDLEEVRAGYHQLDKNWERHHEACMKPIREALGLPDGSVLELVNAIHALSGRTWKQRVLDFAKRLDGIYDKNAKRERHGKQDYDQIHLGGRQTEIATIACELRALAEAKETT